jgi:hypothetical protein
MPWANAEWWSEIRAKCPDTPNSLTITGVVRRSRVHSGYAAMFGHLSRTAGMMEVVGVQRQVAGSSGWSVPMGESPGDSRERRGRGVVVRARARGPLRCPPGWLLLDFPTALLLAVFVGTGWLGYAEYDRSTGNAPVPTVVAPRLGGPASAP